MNYGIGTYTYTWNCGVPGYEYARPFMTMTELLDRAAAFGCGTVQICDNVANEQFTDAEIAMLVARARGHGLDLHLGFRGVLPERLALYLELARKFEAKLVRSMLPKTGPGSDIGDAAAMLAEAIPAYGKAGVALSLENHDRHTCRELRSLVDRIASPDLGICLDTVNSFGAAEDPERVMDALLPVANCLHLKDFTIGRVDHQMGFVVTGTPLGEGMLNAGRALDYFLRERPGRAVIVELWTPYRGSTSATMDLENDWARRSVEWLRKTT